MGKRLAVFSLVEWSYAVVRDWAAAAGHEIAILVTLPPSERIPGIHYATVADRRVTMMVVPTVTSCEAALAALDVDLAVVFTFLRVPDSTASIPRHGTVNLHPALLPAYRGANGYRALYNGEPEIGVTLHRLTAEMDGGPILARASVPTPDEVDPDNARAALQEAATAALLEGVPRALAGDPGEVQDPALVTEARAFTDDERLLALDVPMKVFECRLSALVLAGIQPSIPVDGRAHPLRGSHRLPGLTAGKPGLIAVGSRRAVVAVSDGVLELDLGPLLG